MYVDVASSNLNLSGFETVELDKDLATYDTLILDDLTTYDVVVLDALAVCDVVQLGH